VTPARRRLDPAWRWFAIVLAAGFVVRLIYLLQARAHDPLFFTPQMDAEYHHRWAFAIASGTEFIRDAFFRAPLYPYFLGLLYKLGLDLFWVRVVQAMLGSASCGLTYLLARRILIPQPQAPQSKIQNPKSKIHSEPVARAAGLVLAAYPLAIYFDGELLIPSLVVFLVLLGLVLLYRSLDTGRQWWLPGLAFGLASIARPNVLAFVAVLGVWLLFRLRRRAWPLLGWFGGAVALVILPVTVRNYAVSRTFVPIAWQAGTNFYIGNNPQSDGVTAVVPGTRASWWGGYNDVKALAERALGRELKGAQIDRYWLRQGFEFWKKEPLRALGLTAHKLCLLLSGYEVSNNRNIYYFKRFSFLNLLIFQTGVLKFPFGLLLPLALAGAYLGRRQAGRWLPAYLFVAAFGLSFVAFFITARYRMPLVPILAILACYAVSRFRQSAKREKLVSGAVFALSFVVFNAGFFGAGSSGLAGPGRVEDAAQTRFNTAMALYQQGKPADALEEVRAALVADSADNVLILESAIYLDAQDFSRARAAAEAAVRKAPNTAEPYGQLGNVYGAIGAFDSAQACFEKVVELDPYSVSSWTNLGNVALARSDLSLARQRFERALEIDPTFVLALFNLGLVDYQQGNRDLAHTRWKKVLELDPSFDRARAALEQLR